MRNYPAAAQEGATTLSGLYPVNQVNDVHGYLESAIAGMEAAAAQFSKDCINDATQRANYQKNTKRVSEQVRKEVKNGNLTVKQGAEFCQTMRNRIMEEIRVASSVRGNAKAVQMKPVGKTLPELMNKYAADLFKKPFNALTQVEKDKVFYTIIEASGRPSAIVNAEAKQLRVMGKVFLLVTAGFAIYSIASADNKEKETINQGAVLGAGLAGGWLAGLAVSTICGPAAPFCALALVLAGSMAAGAAADATLEAFDEELEEFTKWGVR